MPDREILPLVAQTLDQENPRDWYYALMDYGVDRYREPYPRWAYAPAPAASADAGTAPERAASICLVMIVKDEAHVVTEALASALPWISGWVVVDTGSTDGTQATIRRFFEEKGVAGRVVGRENIPALGDQITLCARKICRSTLSQYLHDGLGEVIEVGPSSAPPRLPSVRSRTNAARTPIVSHRGSSRGRRQVAPAVLRSVAHRSALRFAVATGPTSLSVAARSCPGRCRASPTP